MKILYIYRMIVSKDIASKIAKYLLDIKAVKLQPSDPFTWASGILSPIYCDNRKILSAPSIRTSVVEEITAVISGKFEGVDAIVGVATGGIAIGALVADKLNLPFAYVRAKVKEHGMKNAIEGELYEDQSVVVIEDLISTGGSSLAVVDVLREEEIVVMGMVAIFTYDFNEATNNFKSQGCKLFTLSNYDSLIKEALEMNYVSEGDIEVLTKWRNDPKSIMANS